MIRRQPCDPLNPARVLPQGREWYVLTVTPRREYAIAHWLEGQGIFSLVPLEKRWRLSDPKRKGRGGRKHAREAYMVPLMPRLVIAGFADPPRWLDILDHQHIAGVLGINHTPVPLRQGEPEALRAISYALSTQKQCHALAPKGKALVTSPGAYRANSLRLKASKADARSFQHFSGSSGNPPCRS